MPPEDDQDNLPPPASITGLQEEGPPIPIPGELPILVLENIVAYPYMMLPLTLTDEAAIRAINDAVVKDRLVAVVAQAPQPKDAAGRPVLRPMGCAMVIVRMLRVPDGSVRILAQGIARVRIGELVRTEPYLVARVEKVDSIDDDSKETVALARSVVAQFQKMVALSPHLPDELGVAAMNISDRNRLADLISTTLNLEVEERQRLLETLSVRERLQRINELISREVELLELSSKIQSQVRSEVGKTQREYFLRQQLKAIQEELGETDEHTAEIRELRQQLEKAKLPPEAHAEAQRELDRLARMPPAAAEYTVARTYLDWILSLPWNVQTRDRLNLRRARAVLDEDHYNLEKVKQRILEFLAVRRLKQDSKGPILCFVGPPGTGKTSLGRSIARAMGRKFVRISLGGVHDEAEIRGHRRTYVGALPGRIIQGLRKAGSRNPVFMLDEVDKLSADFHGDPASALLEVLDPEQNNSFTDHYLDVPFDLSRVMFITTANVLDTVPPALRDRMEVLELPGYSLEEKILIAEKYLIPRQKEENGLARFNIVFPREVVETIVNEYTRESGLRNLEREIATVLRKVATEVANQKRPPCRRVLAVDEVRQMLGPRRYFPEVAERTAEPGVATGLAWTPAGGEIMFVEATRMPGNNRLILTGQLGEVMKESAQAALSYVRAHAREYGLDARLFRNADLHIHVPAAAIRKDGPSAGITIAIALLSLHTGRKVRPDVAMTGEISLRGQVLPVGGIKEKILAAHRAGIRTVIIPRKNEGDLSEVPEHVRSALDVRSVERIDEAIPIAFGGPLADRASTRQNKSTRPRRAR